MKRWALVILLGTLAGCRAEATSLLVVVDTDLSFPGEVDTIRAIVRDEAGVQELAQRNFPLRGDSTGDGFMLPIAFAVLPGPEGPDSAITIEVEALLGGTVKIQRRAVTHFLNERQLILPMFLSRLCEGRSCGSSETCEAGGCVSNVVDPATLDEVTEGMVPQIDRPDAGMVLRDSGVPDDADVVTDAEVTEDGGVEDGGVGDGGEEPADTGLGPPDISAPQIRNGTNRPGMFPGSPVVGTNPEGAGVIAWQNTIGGARKLSIQRVTADGTPEDVPIEVGNVEDGIPAATGVATDGDFVVAWVDGAAVFTRRYASNGTPSPVVRAASAIPDNGLPFTAVALGVDANGSYALAYQQNAAAANDVLVTCVSSADDPATEPGSVGNSPSRRTAPAMAMDQAGNFVVAWLEQDGEKAPAQVNFRLYAPGCTETSSGAAVAGSNGAEDVAVSIHPTDRSFVIAWTNPELEAQWFASSGQPTAGPIVVGDAITTSPNVAHAGNGSVLFAWLRRPEAMQEDRLRVRKYDSQADPLFPAVNFDFANGITLMVRAKAVAATGLDSHMVVWHKSTNIWQRRFPQ